MSTVYLNTHDLRVRTRALIAVSRPGCCQEDGPDTTAGSPVEIRGPTADAD